MKKLIIMSLLVFLVAGLSTSSFFLSDYLTKIINKKKFSIAQLDFALAQDNIAALHVAWKKTQFHSQQWLLLATKLAKTQGDSAYQLAVYYQDNPVQAIFWYKSAIRLNYLEASIALAQLYFQQKNLNEATEILSVLPIELPEKLAIKINILKVNIAINQGKLVEVKQIVDKHVQQLQTTVAGQLLLAGIKKYQVLISEDQIIAPNIVSMGCNNSIQLFATDLNHLKNLEKLIDNFKGQALNHAVCFSPVRYMAINTLDCTNEKNKAIRCKELNWQLLAKTIRTRYVGIMLPQGGANVHLGVLYFDAQDSVDVVTHEISHLLGFIDEYPLVTDHIKCRSSQKDIFSQNISVLKINHQGEQKTVRAKVLKQIAWAKYIKPRTPILQLKTRFDGKQYWQLGTPKEFKDEVGLFDAQTCDNSANKLKGSFNAFKSLSNRTKLQYFALDFPELYSSLLQENSKQYLMPSFHYNIALAYFQQVPLQQKNIEQANYWLEQAENWERDVNRRKRVRQGEF